MSSLAYDPFTNSDCPNCHALPGDNHAWGCPLDPIQFPPSLAQDDRDPKLPYIRILNLEIQLAEEHF